MIEYVQEQTTTFNVLPFKFEAGTENVEGAVALHAAIKYLNNYGWDKIEEHEYELTKRCLEGMKKTAVYSYHRLDRCKRKNGGYRIYD